MSKRRKIKRTPPLIGSVYERRIRKGTRKGRTARMEVVDGADGISYRVEGRDYRTPSAAAVSVTGYNVNGWSFWHVD